MPRLPRIRIDGSIYFVTSRAIQGEQVFRDRADQQMYMELLTKYKTQHQFKVFSYCLLPEELYLLIETGEDATISDIMHDLNSLYTKYYNGRYGKRGHLFESRFRSVLVEKAQYLLQMTRHIHRSPGVDFENYPYSSYLVYVKKAAPDGLNLSGEVQEVLDFLEHKDDPDAYERYCLEADANGIEELEKRLKRGLVLGSDAFAEEVKKKLSEFAEAQKALAKRPNRVLVMIVGMGILAASSSSVYLYISKRSLKGHYETLLRDREAQFAQVTRFENRSPLELRDLEGTQWDIEVLPAAVGGEGGLQKDRISFTDGLFRSERLAADGYRATRFTLTLRTGGGYTWETLQSKPGGDSVSWRGDWQGDAMKGVMVIRPAGQSSRDFSFFSVTWSYAGAAR